MDQRCRRCGRELTDPESVAAGIGAECKEREEYQGYTRRELEMVIAIARVQLDEEKRCPRKL